MPPVEHATFRLPASALFIPVVLFLVTTPLASASRWTLFLYLLPVYALIYVFWTRTFADARAITVYHPFGKRRILWADLDGFEFHGPRWAIAVTLDGKRIRLPMVRPRDLRRLAAVSGGRLYLGDDALEEAEAASGSDLDTTVIGAGGRANDAEPSDSAATGEVPAIQPDTAEPTAGPARPE